MILTLIDETLVCAECLKKVEAGAYMADGRVWVSPPAGWFCADSYPPGDLGTLWMCSVKCLEALRAQDT